MERSPFYNLESQAGATFEEFLGWELPRRYGDPLKEYRGATQGVGMLDRTPVGRLKATGKDALDLLNRLSTNKLEGLPLRAGISTVLTSNKGRILDLLVVVRMEGHLLLLTSPQNRQKVAGWIDGYTFLEEVEVEDTTASTAMLSLVGPRAAELVKEVTGTDISDLSLFSWGSGRSNGAEVTVVRTDSLGLPGYDLIVPAGEAEALWKRVTERGASFGLTLLGAEAMEVIRVERGVPLYGRELSEGVNPLEAKLLDSVSFNKGCYIGQEVIARLNTYQKVQRSLMGILLAGQGVPLPGDKVHADDQQVGTVTSSVSSILLGHPIALAYLKKACARAGLPVKVIKGGEAQLGQVVELPFRAEA